MYRLILVCAALLFVACEEESTETRSTSTAVPTATPVSRCEPVDAAMLDAIFQGTDGLDALENGFAVRSDDFEQVYMIAAVLVGPALDGQVGIWASNRLDGTGLIFAVDGFAQQFSDWGDADKTDANITINNDGVEEAKDCATA